MMRMRQIAPWLLLFAFGCDSTDSNVPPGGPPPVSGGTLHVSADGRWAIASDPDRAAIHVVDLDARSEVHRLDLGADDEPGRAVEDMAGRFHVVLRRAGEVLTLDPPSGTVVERRKVCAAPRGIDLDAANGELVVACAEGLLARLPVTGGAVRTVAIEPDLRDVVVHEASGRVLVSVFRSAEILVLEDDAVVSRMVPPTSDISDIFGSPRTWSPSVAWRMREHPEGAILVHQHSVSTQLGTLGVPSGVYYGGDCTLGVVRSAVSIASIETGTVETAALSDTARFGNGVSLAVDVDFTGDLIYTASAAEPNVPVDDYSYGSFTGVRSFGADGMDETAPCAQAYAPSTAPAGATIAVANVPGRGIIAQYRDPARLVLVASGDAIPLSGGSAANIGHSIFHEAVGTGATCASCHPEGGDDGRVWRFDVGARRTQTMRGGILATLPFHWAGDVPTGTGVMEGTFVGRMGATAMPLGYEIDAFESWVDALPALPGVAHDGSAVDRGRAIFERADCGSCHAGSLGTNNETVDVGTGGAFQVPALYELAYRGPYLHDGRAATLVDAVRMHTEGLSEAEQADVAAYLRSR